MPQSRSSLAESCVSRPNDTQQPQSTYTNSCILTTYHDHTNLINKMFDTTIKFLKSPNLTHSSGIMLNCLKGRSWCYKGLDVKEKDDCIHV